MRENMKIRKAELKDLSRIAEIFVFNNRINYFPIGKVKLVLGCEFHQLLVILHWLLAIK